MTDGGDWIEGTDREDWIKGTTIMGVESGQEGKKLVCIQKRWRNRGDEASCLPCLGGGLLQERGWKLDKGNEDNETALNSC